MIIDTDKIPPALSGASIKVLCHLAEHGSITATDVARVARFTTAAATGCMDRLERADLVMRHRTDDRRKVCLAITYKGRQLVESMRPAAPAVEPSPAPVPDPQPE